MTWNLGRLGRAIIEMLSGEWYYQIFHHLEVRRMNAGYCFHKRQMSVKTLSQYSEESGDNHIWYGVRKKEMVLSWKTLRIYFDWMWCSNPSLLRWSQGHMPFWPEEHSNGLERA